MTEGLAQNTCALHLDQFQDAQPGVAKIMIVFALNKLAEAFGVPTWDLAAARLALRIQIRQMIPGVDLLVFTATRHPDSDIARAVREALNVLPANAADEAMRGQSFTHQFPEALAMIGPGEEKVFHLGLQRWGFDRSPWPRWCWAAKLPSGELVLADRVFGDPLETLNAPARPAGTDWRNN